MSIFWSVLAGFGFALAVVVLFAVRYWRIVRLCYYGAKILNELSTLQWTTFEEVLAVGCPKSYARVALTVFQERKVIEARLSLKALEGVPPLMIEMLKEVEFNAKIAEFFEYREIYRPPRRRVRERLKFFEVDSPAVPATI